MDRLVYVAMSGAKETLRAQTSNNHNLANVSTTGFKADLSAFQAQSVVGSGFGSRAYATDNSAGWDSSAGALEHTGRDLDIAVDGAGWIAVQAPDGSEAYTRAGDLRVDPSGVVMTGAGHVVLGDSGPISVPPNSSIAVGGDGSVSVVPIGQSASTMATVARVKLVNPDPSTMERGEDGLFRLKDGGTAEADAGVHVISGALETSNVNIAEAMTNMIELARHYELQIKAIRTAQQDADASSQLLQMS